MNSENIVLIARLKVKKDAVETATAAALAIVESSRGEKGCLNYDFHQAIDDETVFIWHETWADKNALDEHFAMPYFAELGEKLKDITDQPLQLTLTKMVSAKAEN